jgi:hypothetical protein
MAPFYFAGKSIAATARGQPDERPAGPGLTLHAVTRTAENIVHNHAGRTTEENGWAG